MNLTKYNYSTSDNYLDFEFESDGPKGKIRKIIRYSPQNSAGITYFNLAFGDINKKTGRIDDLSITDNQDREKVLATVAATVIEFTRHFPDVIIYATGSTSARTRLYQMGISKHWNEIDEVLYVFGYEETAGWQPFQKNVNYQAFLVKRK